MIFAGAKLVDVSAEAQVQVPQGRRGDGSLPATTCGFAVAQRHQWAPVGTRWREDPEFTGEMDEFGHEFP